MTTIGYGNHDAARPGSAEARKDAAPEKPTATKRPGGEASEGRAAPKGGDTPHGSDQDHPVATPGSGASSTGRQGYEVDPGVG